MFSFHKPKIYRSNLGCCICKAKSSSSRFTDSKKYENEFERCFRIQEKRSGEICNACVLLVKRWKKLSPEGKLTKHWHHVVDARAGPGTKLTGNRRLTSNSVTLAARDGSGSGKQTNSKQQKPAKSEVLPLSSSQSNNQSTSGYATKTRTGSFSNKVCAIDTNVSTFTFGEPQRRNYMTTECIYSTLSSSSFTKPQSALNSSAFESVIKRYRQRQQQQQLEAQRRQSNRRQRQQNNPSERQDVPIAKKQLPCQQNNVEQQSSSSDSNDAVRPNKRAKRSSESIGTLSIDGNRISTYLDNSVWRKEKICCGTIFRGLYNEVAIFPKLLKPCQCRMNKLKNTNDNNANDDMHIRPIESPPPRATKSGSISSCDSNTSGTGSMEQQNEDSATQKQTALIAKRPRTMPFSKRQHFTNRRLLNDTDSNISTPTSFECSRRVPLITDSPSSSSGTSTSRLPIMADDEDEVDELILGEEDVTDLSNDATSSSVESLEEVETTKSSGPVSAAFG